MNRQHIALVWLALALSLVTSTARAGQGDSFTPVSADECRQVQDIAEKTLQVAFQLVPDAPFVFITWDKAGELKETQGRGCTLTAKATGAKFPDLPGALDLKLHQAFKGWSEVNYVGYGASGGYGAMSRAGQVLVTHVEWEPTPEGQAVLEKECPDSPLDACAEFIKPEQKMYTVEVGVARGR